MNEKNTMTEPSAEVLLEWMTNSLIPLSMFREGNGDWVVVDTQSGDILGSGRSAEEALSGGYAKTQIGDDAATTGGHTRQASSQTERSNG